MKSFFFVPGTKLNSISKIQSLQVDEIIIDLEDAIKGSERDGLVKSLLTTLNIREFWIRIPLRNSFEESLQADIFCSFLDNGFKKFVLPKIKSRAEFTELLKLCRLFSDINIIILIEHPLFLIEIESVLLEHNAEVKGVGLGSHDLLSLMGAKHNLKNLEFPRQKVLYAANAVEIEAIDIASMELKDKAKFEKELIDGFDKGFQGKFIIHPWQLELLNNFEYYSKDDFWWAEQVVQAYNKVGDSVEFAPIVINNEIIERPHLKRAKIIIQKNRKV